MSWRRQPLAIQRPTLGSIIDCHAPTVANVGQTSERWGRALEVEGGEGGVNIQPVRSLRAKGGRQAVPSTT